MTRGQGRGRRFERALLLSAALLVPRHRRAEWRREWEGELDAWRAAGRATTGSALGALPHAMVLWVEGWTMTMERTARDLRIAVRALLKRPLFTLAVVTTLALGIGATVAVFSVVEAVLLRPLPYPDGDRILALGEGDGGRVGNTGFATFHDWRERSRSFSALSVIRSSEGTLTGHGDPERVSGMRVSWSYFGVIGVHPEPGRDFRTEEDRADAERVIILSHGLWSRRFGADPTVVGRPVTLSGNDYTVVGVMPAGYEDLASATYYQRADYWLPLRYELGQPSACRTCRHLRVLARLAPDATLQIARDELAALTRSLQGEHPDDYIGSQSAADTLRDVISGPVRRALWLLFGAVGLVLLIACANVASLVLSRAADRSREVALRSALGATRADQVGRVVVECTVLAGAGGALGLALGVLGARLLVKFAPAGVAGFEHVGLDSALVAFSLGITFLTALFFGLAPVLQGGRSSPATALKEGGRASPDRASHRTRATLVVVDVALALVLLAGVGLTLRSFVGVLRVDPGFDPSNVVQVMVSPSGPRYPEDADVVAFFRRVLDNVRSLPGIESAGFASQLPLGGDYDRSGLVIEGRIQPPGSASPEAERYVIAGDYLRTVGIPLLQGRAFEKGDDERAPYVMLINRTFADRFFPEGGAIGARVRPGGAEEPSRTIVGVVGDVRHYALERPAEPQFYVPEAQWPQGGLTLVARTRGAPSDLLEGVRQAVWSVDRDVPVAGMTTLAALVSRATAQRRFVLGLLSAFAAAATLLAMVGIYGLLSYQVALRSREIGIRVALGARSREVVQLVVARGLSLAAAGVAAGLGASLVLTRFLSGMLFGVTPTDPLTLASAAALMLLVSLVACGLPARRAARLDACSALATD